MGINGSVSEGGVDQEEDPLEDDVPVTVATSRTRVASPPKGGRRRLPLMAIGVLVVVALVVAGVLLSSGGGKSKPKAASTPSVAGFTTFKDQSAGFDVSYPSAWVAQSHPSAVALLVTFDNNPLDDLFVRVTSIPSTVDTGNVADIKAFTDAIISGTGVTVLQSESVTVGGTPAYYYLYTLPKDPTTGVTLVHSHFFIFPPHEMVELLFQTASTDFSGFAHTFDEVLATFQVTAPSSTTNTTS